MEVGGLLSVLHTVSSAESNYFNIFVEGLDDQVFGLQADQLSDVVQNISSLLAKATTRTLGLRLLNKFMDQCSAEVFNKTGNLWTSLTLKACHGQSLQHESMLAYEALGKLASKSLQTPELTKSFATGHVSKVYESLNNVPLPNTRSALQCVEICLRLYPASSGPSRKSIEKFLSRFHDSLDADIVLQTGKCLHLMQQVSGGEVRSSTHKMQWKNYQLQLVGSIHAIFDDMFASCNEIWDDNVVKDQLTMEKVVLSDEPVNRAAQLYIRYHNLVQYLISALKEPFPAEKPILPKMLLGVINRGLSVTCNLLHQNPITDNIALALLLPKIHVDLLYLLDAVTSILRGHILPYYSLILGLLMDILKSTSTEDCNDKQKPFGLLRAKIYDSISLWCKVQNSSSRCDVIAEHLINEILADITPEQNELTLQVCSGAGKHMTKKMKRQLHKAQNERSKISQTSIKSAKGDSVPHREDRKQTVCVAALRCLQEILLSVGSFLKPTKIKLLHINLVHICAGIYEVPLALGHLYSSAQCRLEIYNALYVVVTTPHHLSPPPMDLILSILSNGCSRDGNVKVRNHCTRILQNLEKVIHPQKESLIFPIDGREIRNAFILMGQERLLYKDDPRDEDASDEENEQLSHEDQSDKTLNESENGEENEELSQKAINGIEIDVTNSNENHNDDDVMLLDQTDNDEDVKLVEQEDDDVQIIEQIEDEEEDCTFVSSEKLENIKTANDSHEFPKSPEISLYVEDDSESPNGHQDNELNNDEPLNKRARFTEEPEKVAIQTNGIHPEAINSENDDLNMDDDKLLEDIAAAFVDDLA